MNQLLITTDRFDESWSGHSFNWQQMELKEISERTFTDCEFPFLIVMRIDCPARLAFIRCTFPKLRKVVLQVTTDDVFFKCRFHPEMREALGKSMYSECSCVGVSDDLGYLYEDDYW